MSDTEPIRHVYILGAGASIPLGGPSFNQLLTANPIVQRLLSFEEEQQQTPEIKFIRNVHRSMKGLCACFGMDSEQKDVEQLLERLDYCETTSDTKLREQVLGQLDLPDSTVMSNKIANINEWIRIRIAIETSAFLSQLPDDSERWDPYKKWFQSLSENDSILTFNYDGVVEKVASLVGLPYFKDSSTIGSLENPTDGMPSLLKLHGSADWSYQFDAPDKIEAVSVDRMDIFSKITNWGTFIKNQKHVVIGSPGMSKKRITFGLFKSLWDKASIELKRAQVISIVGYSMPATDNLAKELILESIACNRQLKQINIVLGPDSNSPRARRVLELCKQVTLSRDGAVISNGSHLFEREKIVRLSSMYAQDFLPLHRPKTLREVELSQLI